MAIQKEQIKKNIIDPEHAARHAATHLHIGVFTNTPGMTTWGGANLGELTTIYDLNDLPFFYDYPVLSPQREQVGMIRASASRVLGVPVPATYILGPHWDIESATQWARKYVEDELKGKIIDSKPVCYGYPKMGIAVNWENSKGQAKRTIIDVGDHSIVPEKVEPEKRGSGAISVYDLITEKMLPDAIERFILYEKMVDELQKRAGVDLASFLTPKEFHRVQTILIEMIPQYTSKTLTSCIHGYYHKCTQMHAQENWCYCVPATWQMIFDFWGFDYSQDEIAIAMENKIGFMIGSTAEMNGLQTLTTGMKFLKKFELKAEADRQDPTFAEVKNEINANRPFKYYYDGHSTVCAGYKQALIHMLGTEPKESVYLYDPYPEGNGEIRWEEFGSEINHVLNIVMQFEGFVYLRPIPILALLQNRLRDFLSVVYKLIKWKKN